MVYNWINLIIGIVTIICPIATAVKGASLWLHIVIGIIIVLCAYMANRGVAKGSALIQGYSHKPSFLKLYYH